MAKSLLVGEGKDPGRKAGSRGLLVYKGKIIGASLRTQDGVKPVYVSPGHRVDLKSALRLVLACAGKNRIPIPTREADLWSKQLRLLAGGKLP